MIQSILLYQYGIPLTPSLPVGQLRLTERQGVIIVLDHVLPTASEDSTQYQVFAEVAPLYIEDDHGQPSIFSQESLSQVIKYLSLELPSLIGQPISTINELAVKSTFPSVQFGLSVLSAKCQGLLPKRSILHTHVPLFYVGLTESQITEKLAKLEGVNFVKVKVAQGDAIQELGLIYQILARYPNIKLRLDANQGFTLDEAIDFLASIPKANIDYIEEPCSSVEACEKVFLQLGIKYGLDETLLKANIEDLLEQYQGIGALVLKPMLLGTLDKLSDVISFAEHRGVRCVLSSSFESDIGIEDLALISQQLTPENAPGLDTLSAFTCKLLDKNKQLVPEHLKLIAHYQ